MVGAGRGEGWAVRRERLGAIHKELQSLQRRLDFARASCWWDFSTQDRFKRQINELQLYRAKVERGETDRAVDLETGDGGGEAAGPSRSHRAKSNTYSGEIPGPTGESR